jgi:hypothetical protein
MKPGKNIKVFSRMMRYSKPNIADEIIMLGTGGINKRCLSRG